MRTYDTGSGFTVSFSAVDVERLNNSWPDSSLVERKGSVSFSESGDVIDYDLPSDDADDGVSLALCESCREYGQKHIAALRRRKGL